MTTLGDLKQWIRGLEPSDDDYLTVAKRLKERFPTIISLIKTHPRQALFNLPAGLQYIGKVRGRTDINIFISTSGESIIHLVG
jgi:hypothetical protein